MGLYGFIFFFAIILTLITIYFSRRNVKGGTQWRFRCIFIDKETGFNFVMEKVISHEALVSFFTDWFFFVIIFSSNLGVLHFQSIIFPIGNYIIVNRSLCIWWNWFLYIWAYFLTFFFVQSFCDRFFVEFLFISFM